MAEIIAVHSFRGGTGKSNTIANLAALIALQGLRVGIIDTDIQSPGIHVIWGLTPEEINFTLNDYLWGRCGMKDAAVDLTPILKAATTTEVKGSLHLVPASIKANEIARILREGYDVMHLNDGLQDLIRSLKLDYLLIDTHPGLNEETLLAIGIADLLLILLRPDNQDFQGTAVTVDVARKLQVSKMALLINKALPEMSAPDLQRQVEEIYQVPVVGVLPLAIEVAQMASQGVFCLHYPEHPISITMRGVAERLVGVCV
ncbi:MAG: MinD/ParA family protein [Chamaesiphon sp.]|nr:MinD/ParA family protein [Chamaesiphon sp.]